MNHTIETRAYARNSFNHRAFGFVLNGDGKFVEQSVSDSANVDGRHLFTQETANEFTAHTNVRFEVVRLSEDAEGDIAEEVMHAAEFEVAV